MRYLQVRNSAGELVGLMSGPFPDAWIQRGVISFAPRVPMSVKIGVDAPVFERWDLSVQWWARPRPLGELRQDGDVWPCLVSDRPLDELKRIGAFR